MKFSPFVQVGRFCCGANWTQDQRERIKASFSYVGKILHDRGFYFLPTVPDFTYILDTRHKTVSDSPDIEFGGKWKVRQKLKLAR